MQKLSICSFLLLASFILIACSNKQSGKESHIAVDTTEIRNGDLIFRRGTSVRSLAVIAANHDKYSHVGIIVKTNNKWFVIHAVPGETDNDKDTVKIESISNYLSSDKCEAAKIYRITQNDSIANASAQYAMTKIGKPFDDQFDISDTSSYYCTELVWQAYLHQGIDISHGKRHKIKILGLKGSLV